MERFTVTHQGVPIGQVELPEERQWAGGWLEALPAVDAVRSILARIARRDLAQTLIALERDASPPDGRVPTELQAAFAEAAALSFELLDAAGLKVSTELVRVADSGAARLHVRAYFLRAGAPMPAERPRSSLKDGGFGLPSD